MRSFTLIACAGATLFALVGLERVVSVPPSWLWRMHTSAESCAVYRSFYQSLPTEETVHFRSGTASWLTSPIIVLADDRSETNLRKFAPTAFDRPDQDSIPGNSATFAIDTTDFFRPLSSNESEFIRTCFDGSNGPRFYDGPESWLQIRSLMLSPNKAPALWQVSPVGFSRDGRYALLYAEYLCSGWCGAGYFFLFEKQGEHWIAIGKARQWVA
jgi:hypothetical protein